MIQPFSIRLASARMPSDAASKAQEILRRGWDAGEARDAKTHVLVDM